MNETPENNIADIVQAAGGRLVSRIRLQKIAYLLDQLGAESGFGYSYYHYGPYSSELDNAIFVAEAFDLVEEKFEHRQSDGARYSIFEASGKTGDYQFTYLHDSKLRDLVMKWAKTNITVLELAATAHWLAEVEKVPDWEAEIRRRKGTKTANGRLEEAKTLLAGINLSPGV